MNATIIPGFSHRFFALIVFTAGFMSWAGHDANGAQPPSLRVHFIDVGYADAILIESPDGAPVLIDAGEEASGRLVRSYLKRQKIRTISTAVITHPHKNHFGGFRRLLGLVSINRVWVNGDSHAEEGYDDLLKGLEREKIPVETVREGKIGHFSSAPFTIKVLHPSALEGSPNANSLVLLLEYGKTSMLFTADIEPRQQSVLIGKYAKIRRADCVQIPHHGGPLSEDFIQAFNNAVFVVSTGPNSRGLPREEDLRRLKGKVYRTDRDGTVVLETDGNTVRVIR